MATSNLQSVLLWQHHQNTTPNLPHRGPGGGGLQQLDVAQPATQTPEATPVPGEGQHGETQG